MIDGQEQKIFAIITNVADKPKRNVVWTPGETEKFLKKQNSSFHFPPDKTAFRWTHQWRRFDRKQRWRFRSEHSERERRTLLCDNMQPIYNWQGHCKISVYICFVWSCRFPIQLKRSMVFDVGLYKPFLNCLRLKPISNSLYRCCSQLHLITHLVHLVYTCQISPLSKPYFVPRSDHTV